MSLFKATENRVKCGRCNTEFDLLKNDGCPLCGFGRKETTTASPLSLIRTDAEKGDDLLSIPTEQKVSSGSVHANAETKAVGSWGMFNSFFPGKAVIRILANIQKKENAKSIRLDTLITQSAAIINSRGLTKLRGFPKDTSSDSSLGRLVYHFIRTFCEMGLLIAIKSDGGDKKDVWQQPWTNIHIQLTKEGLEFARLKNRVFDEGEMLQTLTTEEKRWLIIYLKQIDTKDYKEYTILKKVLTFIKQGHNGKDELWNWFATSSFFTEYVKDWSRKSNNQEEFSAQIKNLAPTFAAGKLALLRELGVIKNKRNDYSIVGDLE